MIMISLTMRKTRTRKTLRTWAVVSLASSTTMADVSTAIAAASCMRRMLEVFATICKSQNTSLKLAELTMRSSGRNVCLLWLVGDCRFAESCVYAHEAVYLPPNGWWTDTQRLDRLCEAFKDAAKHDPIDASESISAEALRPRSWRQDLWAAPVDFTDEGYRDAQKESLPDPPRPHLRAPHTKTGSGTGKSKKSSATGGPRPMARAGCQSRSGTSRPSRYQHRDNFDYSWDSDEMEERVMYCGYSKDTFDELLSQGIKPWDEF